MRPHECPFCKMNYHEILKHVGNCAAALVQISDHPDFKRMRTEHPDVLADEAVAAVRAMLQRHGKILSEERAALIRRQCIENLKHLRGGN